MNTTRSVRILRTLFIIGFAYQALESVLPDTRLTGQQLHLWLNTGGSDRLISDLDSARLCFRLGLVGWGIYTTFYCVAVFTLAALAIFRPRRWVFISGSIFVIWQTLFEYLLAPATSEFNFLLIPMVLLYIARALALVGFGVKWPNKSPEPTAVGACHSAVAVHATSRRWLSFLR
jgi:hypothetical protein